MSPTKRSVMSLLVRARAAQNKEPMTAGVSLVGTGASTSPALAAAHQHHQVQAVAASPLIQTAAALQLPPPTAPAQQQPTQQQLQQQLAAAAAQRQPLMQSHTQHTVLAPAIHGLLQAQ